MIVLAVYLLSGPGRIDLVDGQLRFEVAYNLLHFGDPRLRDPALFALGLPNAHGVIFAPYGAGASVTALPLLMIAGWVDPSNLELQRFAFSLTGAFLGALTALVQLHFFHALGVSRKTAFRWVFVTAFATIVWPGSATVLDQIQHAFLVLAGTYMAFSSAMRRSSMRAFLAGAIGGSLLLFQEPLGILLPFMALATLGQRAGTRSDQGQGQLGLRSRILRSWWPDRAGLERFLLFFAGVVVPALLVMGYNYVRFESITIAAELDTIKKVRPPPFGNPVIGVLSLLFSPGKGILLFTPLTLLALGGVMRLPERFSWLRRGILGAGIVHFLLISSLTFFAGDWCWGPRYFVVTTPLLALGLPFLWEGLERSWRRALALVIAASVVVQLLGLSLDHQRFFFERHLTPHFWLHEPWYYFYDSQLVSRALELRDTLCDGLPASATRFAPTPYPEELTYSIFGLPIMNQDGAVKLFKIFHLPRPWPLWMPRLDPAVNPPPLPPLPWSLGIAFMGLAGAALLYRRQEDELRRLGLKKAPEKNRMNPL